MPPGGLALIVGGVARQQGVQRALSARGLAAIVVEDTVAAMAALGRARFRVLVVLGDRNSALPLRALGRVARHRHHGIGIVVLTSGTKNVGLDPHPDSRVAELALDAGDADIAAAAADVMSKGAAAHLEEDTFEDATNPDIPTGSPLLEGSLAGGGGAGATVLAGIFAQELTGRLSISEGAAKGAIWFAAGEPVCLDDVDEPASRTQSAAEVLQLLRARLRKRVCAFIEQTTGTYTFVEERRFLDERMLSKVSPFGLILEVRRQNTTPASLMDLAQQTAPQYLKAGVGLDRADTRLRPFLREKSIAAALAAHADLTVEKFLADIGLDPLMGTLIVLTLVDARLVSLVDAPQRAVPTAIALGELPSEPNPFVLGDQNSMIVDNSVRAHVDALYVELKPARDPHAVLGVADGASYGDVEDAYRKRMAALNFEEVPDAGVHSRLDELRRKVDQARASLAEPPKVRQLTSSREKLGRYEILGTLGAGGMAEVYLGRAGDTRVVIKRILKELSRNKDIVRMFLEEARIAASLDHQNVVRIYDLGESNGEYYIVMELVDGPNLETLLSDAKRAGIEFPIDVAAYIVGELCGALTAAHNHRDENGRHVPIIHRDVTTHNVLIGSDGQVKLADFGVAKSADGLDKTMPGMLKGKAHYLAPEYIQGAPADARSDVFAAGIVLYQCLTGEHPFEKATADLAMNAILTTRCPPVSLARPNVPRALDQIVQRATAWSVAERYQTAHALHLALDSFCAATGRLAGNAQLARFVQQVLAARPRPGEGDRPADDMTLPEPRAPVPPAAPPLPPPPQHQQPNFEEQTLELTWPFAKGG